jgi:hypothetical protein
MDKIKACVADVAAVAKSVESRDLAEAKPLMELLFADANTQIDGGHFSVAKKPRDHLAQAFNQSDGPTAKRFLDELIAWLDREHLGRGT